MWPPTELSEGYNFEAINENYVITDNRRILRVYYVQPLAHVAGMLMAYLPAERIAFEADLFDTHEPPPAAPTPAHAQPGHPGAAHEARRRDGGAGARPAGAVERRADGDGQRREVAAGYVSRTVRPRNQKTIAATISRPPFSAITVGTEVAVAMLPLTKLPSGEAPRNATM